MSRQLSFMPQNADEDGDQLDLIEEVDRLDDDPCPCGISHTRSEHGYDPDKEDQ